ncbi:MAG TPA: tryptophan halogenase family protein [Thermoanaerobaculia bacterium]|nr:tryptophan halogenase family protein [Thermoanaerobaculia bacterium]
MPVRPASDPQTELDLRLTTALLRLPSPDLATSSECRTVAILGGGTAGYLTALALRKVLPHLAVTLIESSEIPILGVGEATTPLLPAFLHGSLGLDVEELFRCVQPTWKLGIRFDWGPPGEECFNFPFDKGLLLDSRVHEGGINAASLGSLLMCSGRSPVFATAGRPPLLWPGPFAYHLENRRFVRYLQEQAAAAGIRHVDRRIVDAKIAPDGETIEHLVTPEGERLAFDLFVDCSGFSSFLLERSLGSPFVSFRGSLFTDTAITGVIPRGKRLLPYTLARTMRHGWCWRIPLPEEEHVGYVFSSAHCDAQEALSELRAEYPEVGDSRVVPFRAGRHEEFWKGNVVAIGNSYGFVEPLESTSLHMICLQIALLIEHFPVYRDEPQARRYANQYMSSVWDALRWFLAIHFKYNRRMATPFWLDCQEQVDVSGAAGIIATFRERGPLSYRNQLSVHDSLWGDYGYDVLLLGQDVPGRRVAPRLKRDEWTRLLARARSLAERALPVDEALALCSRHPGLLNGFAAEAPWMQASALARAHPVIQLTRGAEWTKPHQPRSQ